MSREGGRNEVSRDFLSRWARRGLQEWRGFRGAFEVAEGLAWVGWRASRLMRLMSDSRVGRLRCVGGRFGRFVGDGMVLIARACIGAGKQSSFSLAERSLRFRMRWVASDREQSCRV